MKQFHHILNQASHDTTRLLSAHLRSQARASGWPEHIVRHMRVSYAGDFKIGAHPEHMKEIENLEYGTPSTQPTAALRRFGNRTQEAEKFLMGRIAQQLGGKL